MSAVTGWMPICLKKFKIFFAYPLTGVNFINNIVPYKMINQLRFMINLVTLNKRSERFLQEHSINHKNATVLAFGFYGFINGVRHDNVRLIRINGVWIVSATNETIKMLSGNFNCFALDSGTVLSESFKKSLR